MREAPVSVLDLRSNSGGSARIGWEWINRYTNSQVLGHGIRIDTKKPMMSASPEESWIKNEKLLIILMGKYSASSAEALLDYAYNVENVLIVGENTLGGVIGGSSNIFLPNSACQIDIGGELLNLFPEEEGYMEELRGIYPDIWVPAGKAEKLIVKYLEKNVD